MMKYQCSWNIYVPHLSKTTALKKERKKKKRSDNRRDGSSKTQLGNWETNSRTTEIQTKKPPTFSRLRLERKRHLSFPVCVDKPRNRSWVGRAPMMKSAWKGQVPKEHHYPSAGPSVKQASPWEWAKPETLVPALQGLEFRDRNSEKQFISWFKKGGYFQIQIQMLGATWENHFYILHSA